MTATTNPATVTDPTTIRIRYLYSDIDGHEWFVERPVAGAKPECLGAGTGYGMSDAIRRAKRWVGAECDCDPERVPLARP